MGDMLRSSHLQVIWSQTTPTAEPTSSLGTASRVLRRASQWPQAERNTLAGWTGGVASITFRQDKDPGRDWISVVMSTAFAGYAAHLFPQGLRGLGPSLGLAAASALYEGALSSSSAGAPITSLPASGSHGK